MKNIVPPIQPIVSSMAACTIAARNYLPQATILARSFKRHHPDSRFFVLLVDELAASPPPENSFELLTLSQIGLAPGEEHRMPLTYDATELSTAVKPWLLQTILRAGASAAIYFDPDIEIFAPLDDVGELTRQHSIVLTPHVTEPIPRDGLRLTESDLLAAGIYNLGFIAVGPGSEDFLAWWAARLRRECVIDPMGMRFVDQRWIDFVPGLFPHYILRDPTCNVAYWNLHSREVTWAADHYEVNGKPLRFFHYSGYEPDKPHLLSKHQGDRPRILLSDRPGLERICHEYRASLLAEDFVTRRRVPYGFDSLPGGLKIDRHLRRLYRDALRKSEEHQGAEPPDPWAANGEETFTAWLNQPMSQGSPAISRYLLAIHSARIDLQADFPDPLRRDAAAFYAWFLTKGRFEENSPEALIPRRDPELAAAGMMQEDAKRGPAAAEPAVTVAGYFRAELGVGEAARLLLAGLTASDTPYRTFLYDATLNRQHHDFEENQSAEPWSDINIICINADQIPAFATTVGGDFYEERYSIGVWFWEVEDFPPSLHEAFHFVDEVWVASEFIQEALLKVSPQPVFKFPLPLVQPVVDDSFTRVALGLPDDFTFLFCFDFDSVFERKNPLGLIAAFIHAFQPGAGPALVIKTINGDKHLAALEKLRFAAADRPDIRILDGYVSAIEKNTIIARCDCYVSLHRSEGFGLTMAEAMALGRPVIATAYSGNLEFMAPENSYLCSYKLCEVGEGWPPYPASSRWAEPDLEEAAHLMRAVFRKQDEARERGARAAEDIRRRHYPAVAGAVLRQRINEIRQRRDQGGDLLARRNRKIRSINAQLDEVCAALEGVLEEILCDLNLAPKPAGETPKSPAVGITPALRLAFEAVRGKIESLRALHRFTRANAEQLRSQLREAERLLWDTKVKRADATARARGLENNLQRIQQSVVWQTVKPLWKLLARFPRVENIRTDPDLLFEIEAPANWTSHQDVMVITGWCFSLSGRELAGVRAKVGTKSSLARYGIDRPDVARSHHQIPFARHCGFTIEVRVPSGTSTVRLDSIAQGSGWRTFFQNELIKKAPLQNANEELRKETRP